MSTEAAGDRVAHASGPDEDGPGAAPQRDEGSAPTAPADPGRDAPAPALPRPDDTLKLEAPGLPMPPPQAASLEPTMTLEADKGDSLAVTFFLFLFGLSLIGLFGLLRSFLTDIILALVFSALSKGLYVRLIRMTGRPTLSASSICALIVVLVAIPTTFLTISLSAEAANAIELTQRSVSLDRLGEIFFGEGWLADRVRSLSELTGVEFTPEKLKQLVAGAAGALATLVYDGVNGVLTNVVSGIFHFCIMLAMTFYLLVDGNRFRRFVFRLSPLPDAHEELLLDRFGDVGRAILFGNGIGSAIQGVLGGVAMTAVGLPSPILWATVMTIFAFLPVVGISVVVIPATAYLALTGRYLAALGFFGFCGGMALVVENVVKTRLMGSHMQMHDMLIFLSVIGGIAVYGVLGLLYGPLLVALFLTLADLYQTAYKDRIHDPLARG